MVHTAKLINSENEQLRNLKIFENVAVRSMTVYTLPVVCASPIRCVSFVDSSTNPVSETAVLQTSFLKLTVSPHSASLVASSSLVVSPLDVD